MQKEIDKLQYIYDLQAQLNKKIIPEWDNICEKNNEEKIQWIKNFTIALQQEIAEFIDCFNWKWWSKKENNIKNAKIELVDMLHFYISLCQLVGLSANEIFDIYCQKNHLNFVRQEKGYKENENVKYINGKEDNEYLKV